MALIALAAVTDPEVLILDGTIGLALAPWLADLVGLVARHLPDPPDVVVSSLGPEATALGAVAAALQLVRQRGTSVPWLDTLTPAGAPDAAEPSGAPSHVA
jgi:hypothetical protein